MAVLLCPLTDIIPLVWQDLRKGASSGTNIIVFFLDRSRAVRVHQPASS